MGPTGYLFRIRRVIHESTNSGLRYDDRNDKRRWRTIVKSYEEQRSDARAVVQLATTWVPLALVLVLMRRALLLGGAIGMVVDLALAVPAAGLLVRTFILMHDCAHGSFLSRRQWNDALGWLAGVITLTPYAQW